MGEAGTQMVLYHSDCTWESPGCCGFHDRDEFNK
jgi:hypothetical protein